jgi:hypothetical protein
MGNVVADLIVDESPDYGSAKIAMEHSYEWEYFVGAFRSGSRSRPNDLEEIT